MMNIKQIFVVALIAIIAIAALVVKRYLKKNYWHQSDGKKGNI